MIRVHHPDYGWGTVESVSAPADFLDHDDRQALLCIRWLGENVYNVAGGWYPWDDEAFTFENLVELASKIRDACHQPESMYVDE